MKIVFLFVLIVLVVVPLGMTLKKPRRIFEYPFFMSFAFAVFIVPQAVALIRFPGFVEESSVTDVLLMSCLCLTACFVGYRLSPSKLMLRWTSRPVDLDRLLQAGVVFIAVGYLTQALLGVIEFQFSTENGGMTGPATILIFFHLLAYPGFAIALFCTLRTPRPFTIGCSIAALLPLLMDVVNGRREGIAMFALIVVMALFYERRFQPPRVAIVGILILSMLAIPATGEYRGYVEDNDWDAVRHMDLVQNFKDFLSKESVLELRNGAAIIESTRSTQNYQFGKGYWNQVIFRFVPAQLLTPEFKAALMFDIWDVVRNGQTETGVRFARGSTMTGMGDTFLQFSWFGCLFFSFMGVIFKGVWKASLAKDAFFARLIYVMTLTSGMRAVTHWTVDFLPGFIYFAIFLGIAGIYAGAPRQRLIGNRFLPKANRKKSEFTPNPSRDSSSRGGRAPVIR